VRHRIDVYNEQTAPLIAYYQEKGILVEVDGTLSIEDVFNAIKRAVKETSN